MAASCAVSYDRHSLNERNSRPHTCYVAQFRKQPWKVLGRSLCECSSNVKTAINTAPYLSVLYLILPRYVKGTIVEQNKTRTTNFQAAASLLSLSRFCVHAEQRQHVHTVRRFPETPSKAHFFYTVLLAAEHKGDTIVIPVGCPQGKHG